MSLTNRILVRSLACLVQYQREGADLTHARFEGDYAGATIRGLNLTRANFSAARLLGTRFERCSLQGASE